MDGQQFNNDFRQPVYTQPPVQQPQGTKASGLSIAGLVIGIVSLVLFCLNWVAAVIGLIGLVLSIIGQVQRKSRLGIAAIIVSALGIVAGAVYFVIVLNMIKSGAYAELMRSLTYY